MKKCNQCKDEKNETDFGFRVKTKGLLYAVCKECRNSNAREVNRNKCKDNYHKRKLREEDKCSISTLWPLRMKWVNRVA